MLLVSRVKLFYEATMDLHHITSQEILERISRHCPEAMTTYLQCMNRANNSGRSFFTEDVVEINMSEEWADFKKNIKKLAREDLLEWHPFSNGISVTLAGYEENE